MVASNRAMLYALVVFVRATIYIYAVKRNEFKGSIRWLHSVPWFGMDFRMQFNEHSLFGDIWCNFHDPFRFGKNVQPHSKCGCSVCYLCDLLCRIGRLLCISWLLLRLILSRWWWHCVACVGYVVGGRCIGCLWRCIPFVRCFRLTMFWWSYICSLNRRHWESAAQMAMLIEMGMLENLLSKIPCTFRSLSFELWAYRISDNVLIWNFHWFSFLISQSKINREKIQ